MDKPDVSYRSWIIFLMTVVVLVGAVVAIVKAFYDRSEMQDLEVEVGKLLLRADALEAAMKGTLDAGAESILEGKIDAAFGKQREELAELLTRIEAAQAKLDASSGNLATPEATLRLARRIEDVESVLADVEKQTGRWARWADADALASWIETRAREAASATDASVSEDVAEALVKVQEEVRDLLPVGTILPWDSRNYDAQGRVVAGHREVPEGWRECDGTSVQLDLRRRCLTGTTAPDDVGASGGTGRIAPSDEHFHHAGGEGIPLDLQNGDIFVQGVPTDEARESPDTTYWFRPHGAHTHEYEPRHAKVRFIIKVAR